VTETIGFLEGMATARSIRRFHPDPIPEELLRSVLKAATWAPSGSNSQLWRFVVVRDAEKRRQIGEFYRTAFYEFYSPDRLASETDPARQRMMASAVHLADHMGTEPPVLILFCCDAVVVSQSGVPERTRGSSIYPAVQNLLLAARASGLGGCLTTWYLPYEAEIKALLGLPDEAETYALVPLGYPRDKFGPLRRRPVEEVCLPRHLGHEPVRRVAISAARWLPVAKPWPGLHNQLHNNFRSPVEKPNKGGFFGPT
jgi:nitroreductase